MFSPANQAIPQQVMVCFKRPILIYLPENTHSKLWHPIPLSSGMENNRYKTHHPCPLVENNHRLYYLPAHFTIYYSRKYPSLHMLARKKIERRHKEEILLLRIRNLIEQCNNYEAEQKARLEKNGTATSTCFENDKQPDHPKTTNTESAFLARAIEQVEKNMHVIGYSVEQLSRDLCMERTGLYRKLVNLLDQSPSLFIRNIRLQRAAQLLTENELSIAEIAERTGFSSSSYLSKCFQEMYGCRPSEYARKTKKST